MLGFDQGREYLLNLFKLNLFFDFEKLQLRNAIKSNHNGGQGRLASIFNLLKNIGAWVENNLTTWKNIHPWRNLAISYILD